MSVPAIDFGGLPPEINSARMYSGPGSGPMLAAGAAWDGLAAQLHSAAACYSAVISELEELWAGQSGATMAAAAFPYVAWMTGSATHAEQAAAQAAAAAGSYEAAFAMTVPPPVIAVNRSLLTTLVATNVLGQNTSAIAAAEAQYGEMWAQDAAAMYGYAAASASASTLLQFISPPPITNPGGAVAQAASVAQTSATSAASNLQSILSAIPTALQGLASPAAATDLETLLDEFLDLEFGFLDGIQGTTGSVTCFRGVEGAAFELGRGFDAPIPVPPPVPAAPAALSAAPGLGVGAVSAGMGRATFVGGLSAPPSWAAAAPGARSIGIMAPGDSLGNVVESAAPGMPGMPMVGAGQGSRFPAPRYGLRLTVMPRPVAVG